MPSNKPKPNQPVDPPDQPPKTTEPEPQREVVDPPDQPPKP